MMLALFLIPGIIGIHMCVENHHRYFSISPELFVYCCVIISTIGLLVLNKRGYFNLAFFLFLVICPLFIYLLEVMHRGNNLRTEFFLYILIPVIFSCLFGKFFITLIYMLLNIGYILGNLFILLTHTWSPGDIYICLFIIFACITIAGISRVKSVAEEKQAELVEKTENNFNTLFNNSTFGIVFADPVTKKFITFNNAFCEMLKSTEKQLLQKSVYDIHPREVMPMILEDFNLLIAGRKNYARKIPVMRSDNTVFYADIAGISMELNNHLYMVGFFHDNTVQYMAEEALKASEEKYRFLVENQLDFIIKMDVNGMIRFASRTFCRFMGFQEHELLGKKIFDIIPGRNREILLDIMSRVHEQLHEFYVELDFPAAAGCAWVGWYIKAILDNENRLVSVICTGRDITSRIEAEERLRLEMEKAQKYLNVAGVMIVAIDRSGKIILLNKKGCEILECTEEEIIGKNWFDNCIPEDFREDVKQVHYKLMNSHGVQANYFENSIITRTGKKRIIAWNNTLLLDKGGKPYCSLSSGEDITDRKKAEMEREYLIKELEAKNTRLEQFSYTASHDLKTPLITIKGFLNVLEEDITAGNSEEVRKDFAFICNAVDKMWNLLNDLLQYSRLGRFEIFEEIAFSEIIREAMLVVSGQLKSKSIRVEVADNLPVVKGDKTRLVQLIQNLLDNAIKFSGERGNALIIIGCKHTAEQNIFFVQDNGIGIEPEYHQKVFQLFNQLNPAISGTGIGLTLARRIIEIHGGQIWVESAGKNKGTTINFTLDGNI